MNTDSDGEFLEATLPHLDAVYQVARRMTRDRGQAEDLVQETYVRAFTAFSTYRGGSMRAWLITICLNLARSEGRRARRRPHEVSETDATAMASPGDVSDAVVASVERAAVARALARLPAEQRSCVVLVDLGGSRPGKRPRFSDVPGARCWPGSTADADVWPRSSLRRESPLRHDEATLVAFLEGTLPPAEARAFDAHLLGYESCWAAVSEDRAGRDALRSIREVAPPQLQDRVRLAVRGAASCGGDRIADGPVRPHRTRRQVALAGMVAAVAVTTGALRIHRQAPSADPAPVAAVVELALLQSPPPTTEANPGKRTGPHPGPMLKLGHQNVWLARHLVAGSEVLVATSDQAFPMPSDARPLGPERGAPWLAQRGDMGLACLSRPTHMLLVGRLPANRLVEIGHQLAPR